MGIRKLDFFATMRHSMLASTSSSMQFWRTFAATFLFSDFPSYDLSKLTYSLHLRWKKSHKKFFSKKNIYSICNDLNEDRVIKSQFECSLARHKNILGKRRRRWNNLTFRLQVYPDWGRRSCPLRFKVFLSRVREWHSMNARFHLTGFFKKESGLL